MNFLQLCQQAREDMGIAGTGPAGVTGQTGEMLRVVNWVNKAWEDIQNWNENWNWMRLETSFQTIPGQQVYTPFPIAADHANWHMETVRCYLTSAGTSTEQFVPELQYDDFRNSYQFGAMRTLQGRPTIVAGRPKDKALLLAPVPNGYYTILAEYQQEAQRMSANEDIPGAGLFPVAFHQMIVDRAVMKYAAYEGAGGLYGASQAEYKNRLRGLEKAQLDTMSFGEPLA